jgi:hypothetical protein
MTIVYGPRVRSRGSSVEDSYIDCKVLTWFTNNTPVETHYDKLVKGNQDETITYDVVDRDFKSRQAAGEVFNNPFTSIKSTEIHSPPSKFTYAWWKYVNGKKNGNEWYASRAASEDLTYVALDPSEYSSMLESVHDKANTMAYANRSMVVEAVSMVLAEGKKTVQGMADILFRICKIALAAKKLDWKYLRNEISPSELANRYMELRYAIRPLVIDAENTVKAYNTTLGKMRKTARGGSDDRVVISDEIQTDKGYMRFTQNRTSAYIVEARAGILCDVDATRLNVWGIDQIIETGWEIVPFSFILGWFIDVSNVISSWTPKAGVDELASWCTTKETLVQSSVMSDVRCNRTAAEIAQMAKAEFNWSGSSVKTTITTTRTPDLNRAIWPSLDVNLDCLKVLDLGIILKGIVSGRITKFMK